MPNARLAIINKAFDGRPIGYQCMYSLVNPNGTITADHGALCFDSSGGGVYICTTSGSGWVIITN